MQISFAIRLIPSMFVIRKIEADFTKGMIVYYISIFSNATEYIPKQCFHIHLPSGY